MDKQTLCTAPGTASWEVRRWGNIFNFDHSSPSSQIDFVGTGSSGNGSVLMIG